MSNALRVAAIGAVVLGLSGCFSMRAYDRAELGDMPAHIKGDYRVTAGTPVRLFLRSVDDKPLEFWQHAADVLPGEHRLLIDCSVTEGNHLSRHELNVDVESGVSYRLKADATPQEGCTNVYIEETRL